MFGKPDFQNSSAQEFSTRFHDLLLLETDVLPTGKGATAQKRMLDVMWANSLFCRLMRTAQVETPQLWEDKSTGLPCKARIDMRIPEEWLIVDVKTTLACSQQEFVSNCYRYEYDRQAAFHLN